MANGHGGARNGAGRPRTSEKYAAAVESFHDQAASDLPDRYAALQLLADGGYEQIAEVFEPAGLIFVEDVIPGEDGKVIRTKRLAFPDLPPTTMVCVRRTRKIAAPDRAANEYLIDRVAGRPAQHTELTGQDGAPVEHVHMSLDEWKAEALRRRTAAEAMLAEFDDDAGAGGAM